MWVSKVAKDQRVSAADEDTPGSTTWRRIQEIGSRQQNHSQETPKKEDQDHV
jgi:hypothetical protein